MGGWATLFKCLYTLPSQISIQVRNNLSFDTNKKLLFAFDFIRIIIYRVLIDVRKKIDTNQNLNIHDGNVNLNGFFVFVSTFFSISAET